MEYDDIFQSNRTSDMNSFQPTSSNNLSMLNESIERGSYPGSPSLSFSELYGPNSDEVSKDQAMMNPLYSSLPASTPSLSSTASRKMHIKSKKLNDHIPRRGVPPIYNTTTTIPVKSVKPHDIELASYKEFGLQRWREYVVLKYGDDPDFQKTPHGKDLIVMHGLKGFVEQLDSLNDWVRQMESVTKELEVELQVQKEARYRAEAREMQLKNRLQEFPSFKIISPDDSSSGISKVPSDSNSTSPVSIIPNHTNSSSHGTNNNTSNSNSNNDIMNGDDNDDNVDSMNSLVNQQNENKYPNHLQSIHLQMQQEDAHLINDLKKQLAIKSKECEELYNKKTELEAALIDFKQIKKEYDQMKVEKRDFRITRADILSKKDELQKLTLLRSELSAVTRERNEYYRSVERVKVLEQLVSDLETQNETLKREKNMFKSELEFRTRERNELLQERSRSAVGDDSEPSEHASTGSGNLSVYSLAKSSAAASSRAVTPSQIPKATKTPNKNTPRGLKKQEGRRHSASASANTSRSLTSSFASAASSSPTPSESLANEQGGGGEDRSSHSTAGDSTDDNHNKSLMATVYNMRLVDNFKGTTSSSHDKQEGKSGGDRVSVEPVKEATMATTVSFRPSSASTSPLKEIVIPTPSYGAGRPLSAPVHESNIRSDRESPRPESRPQPFLEGIGDSGITTDNGGGGGGPSTAGAAAHGASSSNHRDTFEERMNKLRTRVKTISAKSE